MIDQKGVQFFCLPCLAFALACISIILFPIVIALPFSDSLLSSFNVGAYYLITYYLNSIVMA